MLAEATAVPGAMGGPGDLDLIYAATRLSGAQQAVETGVAYGWSSLAILTGFAQPTGQLVQRGHALPPAGPRVVGRGRVAPELRSRWTLVRLPDRRGLDHALALAGGTVDLAHYDSDKSDAGRRYAYPRIWAALRPDGVFISDDIQDNFAFRDFVTGLGQDFRVTASGGKLVGLVVKA